MNPKEIEGVFVDDLEYSISFGQYNNLKKFFDYYRQKVGDSFHDKKLFITVKEQEYDEIP